MWYEEHSTPNPLGIEPPDSVKIIKGNKFKQVNYLHTIPLKGNKINRKGEILILVTLVTLSGNSSRSGARMEAFTVWPCKLFSQI